MTTEKKLIKVVALSGGKDSTAMALRLAEVEPDDYTYVCTPTGNEPDEMFAHWRLLGEMLGKRIIPIVHRSGLSGLIKEQNALPNWRQRWCTRMLKIEPYAEWLGALANTNEVVSFPRETRDPIKLMQCRVCRL